MSEVKAVDLEPMQARFASFERQITSAAEREPDLSPVTDLLSGIEGRVVSKWYYESSL